MSGPTCHVKEEILSDCEAEKYSEDSGQCRCADTEEELELTIDIEGVKLEIGTEPLTALKEEGREHIFGARDVKVERECQAPLVLKEEDNVSPARREDDEGFRGFPSDDDCALTDLKSVMDIVVKQQSEEDTAGQPCVVASQTPQLTSASDSERSWRDSSAWSEDGEDEEGFPGFQSEEDDALAKLKAVIGMAVMQESDEDTADEPCHVATQTPQLAAPFEDGPCREERFLFRWRGAGRPGQPQQRSAQSRISKQRQRVRRGCGGSRQSRPGQQRHQCAVCGKLCRHRGQLNVHMRIHTGKKPYECEHCSKCFSRSHNLIRHRHTHSGEKPYKCEHCSKYFSQLTNLITHHRTHSGEKPYKCEHCSKCFRHSHHLITHRRTHTGEKPYKCEHCSKCFSRSHYLITHRRTHSGEKPYKCEHCSKSFRQSCNLIAHRRTHSGEKPYKCELCSKCFSRSQHLIRHRRTHSGKKP